MDLTGRRRVSRSLFRADMEIPNVLTSSATHQQEIADSQSEGDSYGPEEDFDLDAPNASHTVTSDHDGLVRQNKP